MHWILGIALTVAVFVILKQWGALSAAKKKEAAWKATLVIGGALLLFMVLTGRVHVLTAAVAALLPLLRKLPVLLKFWPMVQRMTGQTGADAGPGPGSEQRGDGSAGRSAVNTNSGVPDIEASSTAG